MCAYLYLLTVLAHNAVVTAAVFSPNPNLFFHRSTHQHQKAVFSTSTSHEVGGSLRSNDTLLLAQGNNSTTDSSKSGRSASTSIGSLGRAKANSLTKHLTPVYGYVVVTADYSGSIKVLIKDLM